MKRYQSCVMDEAKKLVKYDFCLNRQDNGGYREITVPVHRSHFLNLFGMPTKLYYPLSDATVFPQRRQLPSSSLRSKKAQHK